MGNIDKEKFKKEFSVRLIKFSVACLKFADKIKKNNTLKPVADQLVRSATSVGANVTEAKGSRSKRDYIKFFEIALKSGYEVQYWFLVIEYYDQKFKPDTNRLRDEAIEITKIIHSSVLTLKGKR